MINSAIHALSINALFDKGAYPHEVRDIQLIETHISWVLLTGTFAYKIKKTVNFGFLDFSTLEKRKFYCHEEIRLNRRLAKDWYLEVVPITGPYDNPVIDGEGEVIEYAVKMLQFPSGQTLSQSAQDGNLKASEIDQISRIVADFHHTVEKANADSPYGEGREIKHWFDENFQRIRPLLNEEKDLRQLVVIESWSETEWATKSLLMLQRKLSGNVRECHGDLHLGNMTNIDGKVVLFDCIEFNPMLRWIDVISEVAFIVMDLLHLGYPDFAFRFLNQYLQQTGDYEALGLLRYYVVYRALVRAKVTLLSRPQDFDAEHMAKSDVEYRVFANLAEGFIKAKPITLIITHGFSGSGKSTYASLLAEKIGAIQLRSDIERKRLFGYGALAKTGSALDKGVYSEEAGQMTYQQLAELAKSVLKAGFPAIIDAAFLKVGQRNLFKQIADEYKVKFVIIDFQASEACLYERVMSRQNDPSEATIEVLRQQMGVAHPMTEDEKKHAVIVNTETDTALENFLAYFKHWF